MSSLGAWVVVRSDAIWLHVIIKKAAAAAGLSTEDIAAFSSHSLRAGAAQDLLCAGYDTADIMHAGGWKSVNILGRYLEFAEHIVWA